MTTDTKANDTKLKRSFISKAAFGHKILGSTMLIIGSCIGAGMLALPIVLGLFGIGPSLIIFAAAWLFMFLSALLLLEAQSWFSDKKGINLVTISSLLLGRLGKNIVICSFLFLFGCIMIAYIEKGGEVFNHFILSRLIDVSNPMSSLVLAGLTLLVLAMGVRAVDTVNRIGMVGLVLSFVLLITPVTLSISPENLGHFSTHSLIFAFPFLVIAFGFHNMIPTIANYMEGDYKGTSKAILYGSLGALAINMTWVIAVIGSLALTGENSIVDSYLNNKMATEVLAATIQTPILPLLAMGFAFFGIFTSMLGQGISVVDFTSDSLRIVKSSTKAFVALAFLGICYLITLTNTGVFYQALEVAGGLATVLLFGIIPPIMVWRGRYILGHSSSYQAPLGKLGLVSMMVISLIVFGLEFSKSFKMIDFTPEAIAVVS